jgi:hypothetical protein
MSSQERGVTWCNDRCLDAFAVVVLASSDGGASADDFDVAVHLIEGLHLNERSGLMKGDMTLVACSIFG